MTAPSLDTLLTGALTAQREAFRRNPFPDCKARRDNLQRLERAIMSAQDELAAALDRDFGGRCKEEAMFSEILVSLQAIRHARKHVKHWMAKRPRKIDWPLWPARAWVMPQPLGVVGIMSSWNYPIFVTIAPLAGALAAGNRVMMKLSEFAPATAECIARLIAGTFEPDHVTVVTGDASIGRMFSALPFDHLLFTGSTAIGREVARAAAANLTPVTLELGGKSPAIVAPDANIDSAAADIAYGKFLNAGQTCIAPDYVFVHRESLDAFVKAIERRIEQYWPDPARNSSYTAIINDRHYARIRGYVEEAVAAGVNVIDVGPVTEAGTRRMPPTLVVNPPDDLRLMQEEIFGPVLPLKTYEVIDQVIDYVSNNSRPLALYLFTKSRATERAVLTRTISGGVCVNDTLVYIAAEDLPFGGVGASGYGHYHGQEGFDTFSKLKPVFRRRWPGLSRTLRPPYGAMHRLLKRILIG
jgi:acyl-CoA reductase-like NAD-dependent aldehyde dehydrogenase